MKYRRALGQRTLEHKDIMPRIPAKAVICNALILKDLWAPSLQSHPMVTSINIMALSELVETYKFWDIVVLWAKERLEHEEIIARVLSKGIIRDGLILNSLDPQYLEVGDNKLTFKGEPYVGYSSNTDGKMMVLRAGTLEHLLAVVRQAKVPTKSFLSEEFISKSDFKRWLEQSHEELPKFWYGNS